VTQVFAYGMLLDRAFTTRGGTEVVGPATLPGWRLQFRYFACVEEGGPEDEVPGLVLRVSDSELFRLDRAEGVDLHNPRNSGRGLYRRVLVDVVLDSGGEAEVELYAPNPQHLSGPLVLPTDYYLDMILGGYQEHGLPTDPLWRALDRAEAAQ
jgi:gamma-glutamylcyclotransferase (GGCT)/AIG2-like uncharacterized protein YtfP